MRSANNKTSFLANVFSDVIHSKDGTEISVRCPYCGRPGKSKMCIIIETDVYHCWVCEAKGRGLTKLISKVDKNKVDEYRTKYASRKKSVVSEDETQENPVDLPEDFKLIIDGDRNDPSWRAVTKYALERGFNKKTFWSFRVGYSNEFGWSRRLIIPSFDENGKLNYITGRAIDADNNFRYKNISAPRKTLVFNEIDIEWNKPLLIAEGPLDLINVHMNKTCLLGSTLSKESLLFKRIVENKTDVVLILDRDAIKKTLKIAKDLSDYSINVKINFPPDGKDLNDLPKVDIEHLIASAQQYDYKLMLKLKMGNI
tara:strand:- start:2911 stop:3849 length:939 start_codon:yes stop_codon:yes gene_type:complete